MNKNCATRRFCLLVKEVRESLGMTQEELADKSNHHRTYISMVERGIKIPTLSTAEDIAKALGKDLKELI